MEQYWEARPTASRMAPTEPVDGIAQPNDESVLSEFNRHHLSLLSTSQNDEEGWQSEMRRYLRDLPANVTKDSDIVEWWQVCVSICMYYPMMLSNVFLQDNRVVYPTLRRIALDFLPCQASSVAFERLFSAGGEVATKQRAQLGAAQFEELQMMKFAWRNNIGSLAALNSLQVEEVDEIREYEDMLVADRDFEEWDKPVDEYFVE